MGILLLAAEAHAACTLSGPDGDGVRTNTCTGVNTGRQQARGTNDEEKLILRSGASITNADGQGILGRGDDAATKVTIETAGDITAATGIQFDMGRPGAASDGLSTLRIKGGTISATQNGVVFNNRALGGFDFDMTDGSIGTEATRVGATGLSAGIQGLGSDNDIDIDMTGGSIYATQRGMDLSHRGTGDIDVDIGSGATIDTLGEGNRGAGLFISRSNAGGRIDVDNAGKVRSVGHDGIYVLNDATGDTPIALTHTGRITAHGNGIYVRQGSSSTSGHGAVSVTSGGDITATGPTGTGINLDLTRGDAEADDDVSVTLTGGTIEAMSTGVNVNSGTLGGLTFDMTGGSIGTESRMIGQMGVNLRLGNTANDEDLDVSLANGEIFATRRGLDLFHAGSGHMNLTFGPNSRIHTKDSIFMSRGRPQRGAGVHAAHSGSGNIDINHEGTIDSGLGTGIYAQHTGTGDLSITNSGTITSGFQGIDARRFGEDGSGRLVITHSGTITASRGPGIFVRHDAPRTSGNGGPDVNIDIRGDVTTTAMGHAAVRVDTRGPTASAGVLVQHTKGKLEGFWGIFATDARYTSSTGTVPVGFTPPLASGPNPKVRITVGEEALIVAKGQPAPGAASLPKARRVARELVGTYALPAGIVVGGGNVSRVAEYIAGGDGDGELSAGEEAVLRAVYRTHGTETARKTALDAALSALDGATYDDEYRNTVRWYAGAYNAADYRVDVKRGGRIESDGDGIRIMRRHIRDGNGGSHVDIDEGAVVKARRYGVRMGGAGMDGSFVLPSEGPAVRLRRQSVEVRGRLESTGPDGAAIALVGGGRVIVGPKAVLRSASGTTIRVDEADPGTNLVVVVELDEDNDVANAFRRVPGRIVNAGTTRAWLDRSGDRYPVPKDPAESFVLGADDAWLRCEGNACAFHVGLAPRARVHAALPSLMLDMNGIRPPARRDGTGPWVSVTGSSASRDLEAGTAGTSYDATRGDLMLGHGFSAGEAGTLGLFLQRQEGRAKVAGGGRVDVTATGAGLAARWDMAPLSFGLHASAKSFSSDLTSSRRGRLATGISGTGHSVGIEVGHEAGLPDATLRMKVGLAHERVKADGVAYALKDPSAEGGTARVAVAGTRGTATTLSLGASYERPSGAGVLFADAGLGMTLDGSADARVGDTHLSASRKGLDLSLQGGIALGHAGGRETVLSAGFARKGGGNGFQAGLSFRF